MTVCIVKGSLCFDVIDKIHSGTLQLRAKKKNHQKTKPKQKQKPAARLGAADGRQKLSESRLR